MQKRADMQKLIQTIGDYKPWNVDDANKATPYTAGLGGLAGAAIGGGSAALERLFGKKEDEEDEPSILGRAVKGGLIGAGLGAVAPGIGLRSKPFADRASINKQIEAIDRQPVSRAEKVLSRMGGDFRELQKGMARQFTPMVTPSITLRMLNDARKAQQPQ